MTQDIMLHDWKFILNPVLCIHDIAGLAQGCSNSIANALELLQLCAKPVIVLCGTGEFILSVMAWEGHYHIHVVNSGALIVNHGDTHE